MDMKQDWKVIHPSEKELVLAEPMTIVRAALAMIILYELRFGLENGPATLDDLIADLAPVRVDPVFINAQVGVTFKF